MFQFVDEGAQDCARQARGSFRVLEMEYINLALRVQVIHWSAIRAITIPRPGKVKFQLIAIQKQAQGTAASMIGKSRMAIICCQKVCYRAMHNQQ